MTLKNIFSRKIIYILTGGVLLYTLVGFLLLPILGKPRLTDILSRSLNREVTIEKIAVNPYSLTAEIDTVVVKGKTTPLFFSAQKIFANLNFFSLFTGTLGISEFSLENPSLNLIRYETDAYNFSDLFPHAEKEEKVKKILNFILENVRITGGEIRLTDKLTKVSHTVTDVSLSLPFLTSKLNRRYEKATMDLDFIFNQARAGIHVESTPFSEDVSTQADIKISDIDLLHYLAYLPVPETLFLKSLDLNLDLHADFQKEKSIESLKLKGTIKASRIDIKGPHEAKILTCPVIRVDLSPSDLFAGQVNVSKVLLDTPELNLNRDKNGQLNLLTFLPRKSDTTEASTKETPDNETFFRLHIADAEIRDAGVFFEDFSSEKVFKTKLFPVNFKVNNFNAAKNILGEYQLNLETEAKETVTSRGRFQTDPVTADGSLNLTNVGFKKYSPYYENLVGFDVNDGHLDLSLDFALSQLQDKFDMGIQSKEILIRALSIIDPESGKEMVNIPELKLNGSAMDLADKKLDAGVVSARNGKILLKRMKDGRINLAALKSPGSTKADTKSQAVDTDPWAVTMTSFDMAGFNLAFMDSTQTDPVSVDLKNIRIKAADLKNFGKNKGRFDAAMDWNTEGRINIKGTVIPSLLNASLDIDLKKIDIKSLQPYFTDSIRILVTDGSINTNGKLNLDMGGDASGKRIEFVGETSVTNFISLDKQTAKDFFKCNSLYLSGLDVSVFPIVVNINEISLTDFYSRTIISDTGQLNLNTVFKSDHSEKKIPAPEPEASETPQIQVKSITLQGGDISFSDYLTQPNFTASMKQVAGSVTGLSSDEKSRAKLLLKGLHGQSAPLDIVGTINPLAKKKFVDIDISYKDIELTDFTPYSSKYLGYKIEKGKLILDLHYRIDGNTLNSKNKVRFDNFELGDRVDSKDATSLPVGLAVSLLKNRRGQIDLDLPVKGELDDPEFKIGSIIFEMISNLIIKVVTSPFAVIGSMFGGGEDLGFIDFDYGQTKISDAGYEKIDTLANILKEKASVNLEIQGGYAKLRDAEGLRLKRFEDLLKAEKLKEMIRLGSSAATLEDVVIKEEERPLFIHEAYARATFPKPKDEAGKEKELDVEEKEKLLLTHIKVGHDDLRLLAMTRSKMVKAYLLSTGKVEKKRIFLLEPSEKDDPAIAKESKVTFLLK